VRVPRDTTLDTTFQVYSPDFDPLTSMTGRAGALGSIAYEVRWRASASMNPCFRNCNSPFPPRSAPRPGNRWRRAWPTASPGFTGIPRVWFPVNSNTVFILWFFSVAVARLHQGQGSRARNIGLFICLVGHPQNQKQLKIAERCACRARAEWRAGAGLCGVLTLRGGGVGQVATSLLLARVLRCLPRLPWGSPPCLSLER
jgi:hypothetical protein